jgi:hypothetical protein
MVMADDEIQEAIQKLLDKEGDGWTLTQYVIAMGLARMSDEGVESIAWYYAPGEQPAWQTEGLLKNAVDLHENGIEEDD